MATQLAEAIDALVLRGWPCDPDDVCPPCWYTMCLSDPVGPGSQWDYERCNLPGREGVLWVYPTGDLRLQEDVAPSGTLGPVSIETTGAPDSRVDEQTLHKGQWVSLNTHLHAAVVLYLRAAGLPAEGSCHG